MAQVGSEVLFVCAANVCRSPLMELTFRELSGTAEDSWRVASRGVSVKTSLPMCEVAASLIIEPESRRRASAHRSVPAVAEEMEQFGLIITASRAERAAVARLSPAARSRTFTLLEATRLGAGLTEAPESVVSTSSERRNTLARYVAHLDAQRGIGLAPEVPGAHGRAARLLRKATVEVMDLPDRHELRASRHHRRMLDAARGVTAVLHAQLTQLAQP